MPSVAIAIRNQTLAAEGRRERWLGSTLWSSTPVYFQSSFAQQTSFLSKPATVVNPRRADGTRAMSAYSTQWFRADSQRHVITSAQPISSYQDRFIDFPAVPVLREAPGMPLETIASGWLFTRPIDKLGADAEARTRTLNKLSQKKWDLGVAAGELKQTVGLVSDLADSMVGFVDRTVNAKRRMKQQLHRFFRRVRQHGDFYQAAAEVGLKDISLLEDLRNAWMQYSFGVKPLVSDIQASGKYLSDLLFKDAAAVTFRVKAGAKRESEVRDYLADLSDPVKRRALGTTTVWVHYSVVYEMPIGGTGPLNELGLDNGLATAWELTTLSWMVDYVLGMGDWLQSLTATKGLIFREGCRSELERCVISSVELKSDGAVDYIRPAGPLVTAIESGRFTRSLIPAGGLTPAIAPTWKNSIGLVQLGQSLFALSNLLQGKPGLR